MDSAVGGGGDEKREVPVTAPAAGLSAGQGKALATGGGEGAVLDAGGVVGAAGAAIAVGWEACGVGSVHPS